MKRIPNIKSNAELNLYYENENLENTDYVESKNLNARRLDAFVGFSSTIFLNPDLAFANPDDINELEWYDEL